MNYEPSAPIPLLSILYKIISLYSSISSYSFSPPLEKTPPEQESQKSMVKVPVPLPWLALVACVLASSIPADSIAGDEKTAPRTAGTQQVGKDNPSGKARKSDSESKGRFKEETKTKTKSKGSRSPALVAKALKVRKPDHNIELAA